MKLSNKVYDVLKWIALIVLDAVGLFYSTIANIWGLPLGDEIMGTCAALSVLIGTVIGISSAKYNKSLNITDGRETKN